MKPRILIADPLAAPGPAMLAEVGEVVERFKMPREELLEAVRDVEAIIVRSETKISADVIDAACCAKVIARAGVGVDNVDVDAATRRGILVVNSPAGNTLAAAEHTLGLLMASARNIPQAHAAMRSGKWDRKFFIGHQVLGKALGVVGFGRIGREVAQRARAMGMKVLVHDPFVANDRIDAEGAAPSTLDDLLALSDFVSLHVALRDETRGMIGERELRLMKPTAIFINCARGDLVDEPALIAALRDGSIGGAALDVFADDKNPSPELLAMQNVIVTPHLGAATEEAQAQVAIDAAEQVIAVLQGKAARWAVNAPVMPPEVEDAVAPYLDLASCLGAFAAGLATRVADKFAVAAGPGLADEHVGLIARVALAKYLRRLSGQPVTYVNALLVARERGLELAIVHADELAGFGRWMTLTIEGEGGSVFLGGAVLGDGLPRLVRLDGFAVDFLTRGRVVLLRHGQPGKPGFIGRLGSLLGDAGISITGIEVGLEPVDGVGLMLVSIEQPLPEAVRAQVENLPGVLQTVVVDVGEPSQ
jgi:D-3-phosphoglycerate dehydrogenase